MRPPHPLIFSPVLPPAHCEPEVFSLPCTRRRQSALAWPALCVPFFIGLAFGSLRAFFTGIASGSLRAGGFFSAFHSPKAIIVGLARPLRAFFHRPCLRLIACLFSPALPSARCGPEFFCFPSTRQRKSALAWPALCVPFFIGIAFGPPRAFFTGIASGSL